MFRLHLEITFFEDVVILTHLEGNYEYLKMSFEVVLHLTSNHSYDHFHFIKTFESNVLRLRQYISSM